MTKADIKLPNGTHITIDGSSDDISQIVKLFHTDESVKNIANENLKGKKKRKGKIRKGGTAKSGLAKVVVGPQQYTTELSKEGFFKSKKTIGDLQEKLEEMGHIYPITTLSGVLLRLVKKKTIRRIKEKDVWVYVNQ